MSRVKVSKDLLKVKDLIGTPRKVRVRSSKDEFRAQLSDLGYRLDKIEEKMSREDSSIDLKRKNQIIHLLKAEKMTSDELGERMGLSRSRANQYLKVMEKDELVRGEFSGKKKFYKVVHE